MFHLKTIKKMKRIALTFTVLFAISVTFFSCTSSSTDTPTPAPAVDAREKYVGNWAGGFSELDFIENNSTSVDVNLTLGIKKGDGSNQLIIFNPDNNQTVLNATITPGTMDNPGESAINDAFVFNGKEYKAGGSFRIASSDPRKATSGFNYGYANSTITGRSIGIFTKQ